MIKCAKKFKPALFLDAIAHFGPRWIFTRSRHQLRIRMGYFRRLCPLSSWEEISKESLLCFNLAGSPQEYLRQRFKQKTQFFFGPSQVNELGLLCLAWDADGAGPIQKTKELSKGRFQLFGGLELDTGFPPDWHRNYLQELNAPCDAHWSIFSDFTYGDIKVIWEISRFPFVFALARAYARTSHEEYAETFWAALEDWLEANPPQAGVNWKCGQEISLRLMTWCFGLYAFLGARATSGERILKLVMALHHFGQRIEANLGYALSQNNNHGVSEATGLWTLGVLFPEFGEAERWRKLGTEQLESQARELIYPDGGFSQLSPNYHRLVLQLYTWTLGLGRLNGIDFSPGLKQRLRAALNWSYQLLELQNGRMPNSGGHDGTHLFPLSNCAYDDYRPTLQALSYLLNGERLFPPGPWDEQTLWISGHAALNAPHHSNLQVDFCGGEGGFHVLRNPYSWAVLRCGPYHHRPVHADLLHLDVWWKGINVALDPGSYSYNPQGAMQNGLAGTEFHNTVSVGGQNQMTKVGRFMWLPWAHSVLLGTGRSRGGHLAWMEGIHLGYKQLPWGPIHRRVIISISGQWWLVLDYLMGGRQISRLHWLLADAPHSWDREARCLILKYPIGDYQLVVDANCDRSEAEMLRADPTSPRGWCSPFYQSLEPAISLALHAPQGNETFLTVLGPAGFQLERQGDNIFLINDEVQAKVSIEPGENFNLASSGFVELKGSSRDILALSRNHSPNRKLCF